MSEADQSVDPQNVIRVEATPKETPVPVSKRPVVEGFFSIVPPGIVGGWAFDRSEPEKRQEIEIWEGDHLHRRCVADRFRADLLEAKIGDGKYGFSADLRAELASDVDHVIIVKVPALQATLA